MIVNEEERYVLDIAYDNETGKLTYDIHEETVEEALNNAVTDMEEM